MATIGTGKFDSDGRPYRTIVGEDSSGNKYVLIVDSDGHVQADVLSIAAGTNRIGKVQPDMHEVRVVKALDASIGVYTAGDMVNDTDCCVTASAWQLTGAANANGGYGAIWAVDWFNETENQAVQYELLFFNATPTGEVTDNTANVHPNKADRTKWLGPLLLPTSIARGAAIASYAHACPSTTGGLPFFYKCAAGSTTLSFVVVTRTGYTQTATDDIEFVFNLARDLGAIGLVKFD